MPFCQGQVPRRAPSRVREMTGTGQMAGFFTADTWYVHSVITGRPLLPLIPRYRPIGKTLAALKN